MRTKRCRSVTLITSVLLTAVLGVIVLSGKGLAAPLAVVTLQDGAVISGSDVVLGSIAEIEGTDDVVQALSQVVVGRAPLPGKERTISVGYVEVRIRQAGASTQTIKVKTDNGKDQITISAKDDFSVSGQGVGSGDMIEVWRLVSNLERHTQVGLHLVEKVTVSRHSFAGTPVIGDHLEGMRAKRTLRSGEILTLDMLEPIPLVTRGQRVSLRASFGAVEVVAQGIAQADGMLGETIPVANITSGEIVDASIVGAGLVEAAGSNGG